MATLELTDVRTCWEEIKPGLMVIAGKCDADWRIEDVYAKLVTGEWHLYLASDGLGFVVLREYRDRYQLRLRLSVECAFYRGNGEGFEVYEPILMAHARKIGAVCLEARSNRRGFERKGWKIEDIIYSKEVGHE